MSASVTLLVLLAALFHALWNALVKSSEDALISVAGVSLGCAVAASAAMWWTGWPTSELWAWIAVSVLIHTAYMLVLAQAYQHADFSTAYPIARGLAPAIVAGFSVGVLSAQLSVAQGVAIASVLAGIALAATARWRHTPMTWHAFRYASLTAVLIAAYTLLDGTAVRQTGKSLQFVSWTIFLQSIPITAWAVWRRGSGVVRAVQAQAGRFLLGGAISYAAYAIVLWAMTQAPIAVVAALRETSIVFAALIGWWWMGERGGWQRLAAVGMIFIGVLVLRLA